MSKKNVLLDMEVCEAERGGCSDGKLFSHVRQLIGVMVTENANLNSGCDLSHYFLMRLHC